MVKRCRNIFHRGELITWKKADNTKLRKQIRTLRKQLGIGPFLVGSVGPAENPKQTGHPQVLTLRHPDDLTRVFFEKSEHFSGTLFKIYDEDT